MDREYKLLDMEWADQVLDCPNCKDKDHLNVHKHDSRGENAYTAYYIECDKCEFDSEEWSYEEFHPLYVDEKIIINYWNETVIKQLDRIEELK